MSCTPEEMEALLRVALDGQWPTMLIEVALAVTLGYFWRWSGESA